MMKKSGLSALLLGAVLFTGLGVTSLSASDAKCGAEKKAAAKCGAEKKTAKCGAEKKAAAKCGAEKKTAKCGAEKKAPEVEARCGAA
jgi:hypothetical protein